MTRAGRFAASAALLIFAILAALSGVDRNSAYWPGIATQLPENFKAVTWQQGALAALERQENEAAIGMARRAIVSDPANPDTSSTFATAHLAAGDGATARQAFEVADDLSLRSPLAQAFFFESALRQQDTEAALRRMDILMRIRPRLLDDPYFFKALEGSEQGREALAASASTDAIWVRAYLVGQGLDDAAFVSRAAYLSTSQAKGFACQSARTMSDTLSARGQQRVAQRLLEARCVGQVRSDLVSLDAWQAHRSGDIRVTFTKDDDPRIVLENRSSTTRLALSRPIALPAGRYRVSAAVENGQADKLVPTLNCGVPARPSARQGSLAQDGMVRLDACEDRQFAIWIKPGRGSVRLSDIRIEPL